MEMVDSDCCWRASNYKNKQNIAIRRNIRERKIEE